VAGSLNLTGELKLAENASFYGSGGNELYVKNSGSNQFFWQSAYYYGAIEGGPMMLNEAGSLTNPTFAPNRLDADTGLGADGADGLSLITNSVSRMFLSSTGSVGIASTTPWGLFSVNPNGIGTGPEFVVGSSTATHLIVLNNGNVGIGTTSPGAKLDVTLGATGTAGLKLNLTSGFTAAGLEINGGGTDITGSDTPGDFLKITGWSVYSTDEPLRIYGQTNFSLPYVINAAGIYLTGNLKIGGAATITSANTGGTWTMNQGAVTFDLYNPAFTFSVKGAASQTANLQDWKNSAGTVLTVVDKDGNVGIGTTTPWGLLSVNPNGIGTGPEFVVGSSTATHLIVTNSGNIGIGDSTPSYQLEISTDSAAKPSTNTWTVASDARIKTDVNNFTDGLSTVLNIHPVTYKYNGQGGPGYNDTNTHIGIIAQELEPIAPYMVETRTGTINNQEVTDFKTYQGHALSFILVNAIKELNLNLETLTGNALLIGGQATSSTATSISFSERFFSNLFSRITTWLGEAGNGIENIFAKIINSDKIKTKEICVSNDSGETCITRTQLDTLLSNVSSSNPPSQTSTTTPTDTTTPVITILGDNPAVITVGTSYSDMGATVADTGVNPLDLTGPLVPNNNLGLHYSVDGITMNDVSIDTSTSTTHVVVYSTVDGTGNWGYATRTIEVIAQ